MKKLVNTVCAVILTLAVVGTVNAQKIQFESTTHDFGTVTEDKGDITHEFVFTNTGDKPLVVQRVSASCGCTTSGWTKEPVQPGEKGIVKATYGAKGRVYPFNKTLTVFANGDPARVVLTIKGTVVATPVDIKVAYPEAIGKLRLKNLNDIDLPQTTNSGQSQAKTFEVANPEKENIEIIFENVPDYLLVRAEPTKLEPQQKGVIRFMVDGSKRKKFGYEKDVVTIKVGDAKKAINVSSIVSENIQDNDNAPRAKLKEATINLGTIAKGKEITANIEIENDGESQLDINNVTFDNPLFSVVGKLPKIKASKTGKITISAKKAVDGINEVTVYINTSAPKASLLTAKITAEVK